MGQRTYARCAVAVLAGAVFAFGVRASEARPAQGSGAVTISMLSQFNSKPGWDVLIPNFERVYPNIKVAVTYTPSSTAEAQLETTELAAGNAPDVLSVNPGCGSLISVCALAKAGYLAPMVNVPWAKRSLPLLTSMDKYGQGLFGFTAAVAPEGVFTNDALFKKLGLTVPRTFSQLLSLCRKAKADGTAALIFAGAAPVTVGVVLEDLAATTVYRKDRHWNGELKAGKVTFDGTPGWHQALQEFIDMNNAGCFQAGATGTSFAAAPTEFAQGLGLMLADTSSLKGVIDAANPQFTYSFYLLPAAAAPNQTSTFLTPSGTFSISAQASAQARAAAQTFIDFLARPKQNALLAQIGGGLTQYEFRTGNVPAFMSSFATVFKAHEYVIAPSESWWNANVSLALQQNGIGLITGQRSIDDVLNAMDAAWKQGPS